MLCAHVHIYLCVSHTYNILCVHVRIHVCSMRACTGYAHVRVYEHDSEIYSMHRQCVPLGNLCISIIQFGTL